MHVQDYGSIAVFSQPVPFQDLLDTLHVERSVPFQDLLDTLRVERSVSFQALLDSFHVERPVSFQALLCSSARAESNTSSRVLRYCHSVA